MSAPQQRRTLPALVRTLRENGRLLVAEKYDPAVNWATQVDMQTGRPQVVAQHSTQQQGEDKKAAHHSY